MTGSMLDSQGVSLAEIIPGGMSLTRFLINLAIVWLEK